MNETRVAGFRPFALERYFAQHEFNVTYNLAASDCETMAMRALLEHASPSSRALWEGLRLSYTRAEGLTELRECIAADYRNGHPDDILTVVPVEGIYLCIRALVESGDEVIAPWPAYQSLHEVAEASGATLKLWRPNLKASLDSPDFFDLDSLRAQVTEKTRVIVVNFPHNPTGATLSHDAWRQIIEIAAEAGAWLLSDEMYRGLEFGGPKSRLCAAYESDYERAITLCGLSKRHGLPGLRAGWLATRESGLMSRLKTLKDYTTICAPGQAEVLALIGMEAQTFLTDRSLRTIERGFNAWDALAGRYPALFEYCRPAAGPIVFPRFTHSSLAVDNLAEALLEEEGLLILPGSVYDSDCKEHFRIGLGRDDAPNAIARLDAFLGSLE